MYSHQAFFLLSVHIMESESSIQNRNNLQQLRKATDLKRDELSSSLKPAIDLLHDVFKHLELKGELFDMYEAAADNEFWAVLLPIDATLTTEDRMKNTFQRNLTCVPSSSTVAKLVTTHSRSRSVD